MKSPRAAFTLIELLVVIAIIVVLASLLFAVGPGMLEKGRATASLNNLRSIGAGFQAYANENDFQLPSRVESADKWPLLLHAYLSAVKVYADPGDPKNFLHTKQDPLSNGSNNTSYIMNGFNDRGAFEDENAAIKLPSIEKPSDTILLGNQSGSGNFYMDTKEGNHRSGILRKDVFSGGANYLFVDGSVRFMTVKFYDENDGDRMWLADKTAEAP